MIYTSVKESQNKKLPVGWILCESSLEEDAINKLFEQLKNIPKEQICYEEPIRVMEMECPSNMTCEECPYADDCYE